MPFIEGVGDELVYAALVAAPVVFICRCSLGHPITWLKHGAFLVRKWVSGVWSSLRGQRGGRGTADSGRGYARHMEAPADNDCCSICHDNYTLPVQANCAHWFCGEVPVIRYQIDQPFKLQYSLVQFIVMHSQRPITLFIPSEVDPHVQTEEPPNSDMIMSDIAKYNRIFGGGVVSIFQLLFLAFYVFSPLDIIPEGIVGLVGLLDDLLVLVIVLFYLAMLYRSTLLLHHGGHAQ
ncbi:hypothetical protein AXG93_1231s1230 [Marchantia polymorpha subsp. ruderalis]|uniref:DUF1232 domain-containing protein n=1 Tax=Marchantia polymorpha subsp. ruderalis TaxID=1480154 RepID=A0A176VQ19_MARPO|nr:hypothetical protein AXG93_1231s1230 [Marchantia polymorpha subsp. ruderalis]